APTDKLAADLMKMNQVSQTAQTASTDAGAPVQQQPQQPAPPSAPQQAAAESAPPIDPAAIVGTWHATRSDGSSFDLTLNQDKTFVWDVKHNGHEQKLTGTYDVEKNLLALESPQAGGMIAQVSTSNPDQFNFKLLGAPSTDQGLAFSR
ncbi:MAG: hypothetical protein JNL96_12220, partial [Planctomycetaceae bacterium]|nr:hypothetical protein [Planctomycetaceae bacterium]